MNPENPEIFPREPLQHGGFTLRDYFAAKAMQAAVTRNSWNTEELAKWSYELADALLDARGQ